MDFSKFNSKFDVNGLKNDIKEAQENNVNYDEVPKGTYEVKIEKMELTESKKGDPMFSCWFKIVSENQNNRLIFMNQVITQGFQIHIVNEFLRSLDTGIEIAFDDFEQYAKLISSVFGATLGDKLEFALEYGEHKGFPTFKITEVFEA